MSREMRVTEIESEVGTVTPIRKLGGSYAVPVAYVTEDGVRHSSLVYKRLFRQAKAYAESLPLEPPEPTYVLLNAEGKMVGTRVSFAIGGKR
jgi:hypothetical protein